MARARIDLSQAAGFALWMDGASGTLAFGGVSPGAVSARSRQDLLPVLADAGSDGPEVAYTMYRDVGTPSGRENAAGSGLRFDLTVLAPGRYGQEFVKTFGHDHPEKPGAGIAYPELYEVVHGRALYLLQRRAETGRDFSDVVLIEAKAGQSVLIPPGYGHVTVNVGSGWLVTANWVERSFASDYSRVRTDGGAAVFVEDDGRGGWRVRRNPRIGRCPEPRVLLARPELGMAGPIYRLLADAPEALDFLARPESHGALFRSVGEVWHCYAGHKQGGHP